MHDHKSGALTERRRTMRRKKRGEEREEEKGLHFVPEWMVVTTQLFGAIICAQLFASTDFEDRDNTDHPQLRSTKGLGGAPAGGVITDPLY